MLRISKETSEAFLLVEKTGKPRGNHLPRRDQKAAKNCFKYDCRSNSQPLGFKVSNTRLQRRMLSDKSARPPRHLIYRTTEGQYLSALAVSAAFYYVIVYYCTGGLVL